MSWIHDVWGDVRFAARQLRRTPGFALVAVLTLALGIGVNSAIFALVDATLLRPLPFPQPDRLVMVWERTTTNPRERVSPLNLLDWAERNRSFDLVSGYVPGVGGMVMAGADGLAENVSRQWIPLPHIFDVLGVTPIVGRSFRRIDDAQRANVIVLSESFWRTRFGGDPAVVGRDLRLDGDLFSVVGVMPDAAKLVGDADIWALRPVPRDPNLRAPRVLLAVARLKPDVTIAQASADLESVAHALAMEHPAVNAGRSITIEPLRDALVGGDLRRTSTLFIVVVSVVLLICCANIANLLLARGTVRRQELAVRVALGAGRARVARQLMTESLLLSCAGGAVGLVLGWAILAAAPSFIPRGLLPGAVTLTFDLRVVAFSAAAIALAGLAFGVAPAWQATTISPQSATGDTRTIVGRGSAIRGALVVGEVAMAVLLLFGAGLLLRTLLALEQVDRGYGTDNALTMVVDPMGSTYPTAEALTGFFSDVEREIRSLPGVADVAWTSTLPYGPSYTGAFAFDITGDAPAATNESRTADLQIVSSTYFRTMDLPIVEGRPFTEHDHRQNTEVCIVNEAFVRTYLHGRSPVGVRLALRPAAMPQAKPVIREIVGVARQVKQRPDETGAFVQVYAPMSQLIMDDLFVVVRPSAGDSDVLAPAVRAAIGRVDKAQLVSVRDVRTLDDIAGLATARYRFRAVLVTAFAALALLLAMVGVFGTLAYTINQRMRELGVRIALGASARRVVALVIGSAGRLIAAGLIIGLVLAAVLARTVSSMLFGVEPLDPFTFVAIGLVLTFTALLSTAGPALRAIRIDPARTLRGE